MSPIRWVMVHPIAYCGLTTHECVAHCQTWAKSSYCVNVYIFYGHEKWNAIRGFAHVCVCICGIDCALCLRTKHIIYLYTTFDFYLNHKRKHSPLAFCPFHILVYLFYTWNWFSMKYENWITLQISNTNIQLRQT